MARTTSRAVAPSSATATLLPLLLLLLVCEIVTFQGGHYLFAVAEMEYTETFRSPGFDMGPGDAINRFLQVQMPQGHVALRSFDAQAVDENGTPIALSETYLHHWVLVRFYTATEPSNGAHETQSTDSESKDSSERGNRSIILVPNSGVCTTGELVQLFGLGSETRHTNTTVPSPYGIVVGDPKDVPGGYEEEWVLNVHAIDTRGAIDVVGCTECVCELYNKTVDADGKALPADYEGGLECCHDETHCAVRAGFQGSKRVVFMEYTVTWVDMSDQVVPLRVFILDITDGKKTIDDKDLNCEVEYTVPKCAEGESKCIHTKEGFAFLRYGGDVIYAVAHQHRGGVGSALHNEDGEEICSSFPVYGNGSEAANESGYIVGMSTCYPEPGSVKVRAGEKLRHTSWYNNTERHTGVMGLFYLLVADSPPQKRDYHTNGILVGAAILAAFTFIGVTISRQLKTRRRKRGGPVYQAVPIARI